VTFEIGQTEREVNVFNTGGDLLTVNAPTVSTNSGGSWLSAVKNASSGSSSSDTKSITITTNPSGLGDGLYTGSVTVTSNGGTKVVSVSMVVGTAPPVVNIDIFILVVEASTFTTVAEAVVNPSTVLDYSFDELAPGDYYLFGGSDDNDDGFICDVGDTFCGAWPTLDQPAILTKGSGNLSNIDFAVSTGFSGQSAGERRGIQRLR
jgi:serine protease